MMLHFIQCCFLCSTPFGITDCFTKSPGNYLSGGQVCSTPFGITDCFTLEGVPVSRYSIVLNAFRHHRLFHISGLFLLRVILIVLNAFRHHRLFHIRVLRNHVQNHHVLNAFRHHRLFHPTNAVRDANGKDSAQRLSASQIVSLRPSRNCRPPTNCAQRLSASQIVSRPMSNVGLVNKLVLNAFRHHRLFHPRHRKAPAESRPCAQRLSASQIVSRDDQTDPSESSGVLNAFRHHRLFHRTPTTTCFYRTNSLTCHASPLICRLSHLGHVSRRGNASISAILRRQASHCRLWPSKALKSRMIFTSSLRAGLVHAAVLVAEHCVTRYRTEAADRSTFPLRSAP